MELTVNVLNPGNSPEKNVLVEALTLTLYSVLPLESVEDVTLTTGVAV